MSGRLASLDSVRAIAVCLVILFHYGWLPVGWVGVQIFFVLSGYFITDILIESKSTSFRDYLAVFFRRRARRIFPVYYFLIGVAFLSYQAWGVPQTFVRDWPYLITYTTNFARLSEADVGHAFVHLWSLAIEEQFYLVWPFVVYFCSRDSLKKCILVVLCTAPILRLVTYIALSSLGTEHELVGRSIYNLPITQADAFAFGGAIAVWKLQTMRSATLLLISSLSAASFLGASVLVYTHFVHRAAYKASLGYQMYMMQAGGFVWGYSLINLVSALFIICAIQRNGAFKALDNRFAARIGLISYGIYLYHVPLLSVFREIESRIHIFHEGFFACYLFTLLCLSEASFRIIETPFLRKRGVSEESPRRPLVDAQEERLNG